LCVSSPLVASVVISFLLFTFFMFHLFICVQVSFRAFVLAS
jgi:hypothetical protein